MLHLLSMTSLNSNFLIKSCPETPPLLTSHALLDPCSSYNMFVFVCFYYRYYPALKTLEQLEHTYLPRVKRYRFCEEMAENIPKLREGIKEASMSDLKDFLESIRKHSDWIGEEAMKQVR